MKEKGEDWRKGRTIAEIKATYAPSAGAQQEIEKELRSKEAIARINYIRVTQSQAQEHIITQCQKRSNSWVKVQCILVTCIKALLMMLLGVPNLMPQIAAKFTVCCKNAFTTPGFLQVVMKLFRQTIITKPKWKKH